MRAQIITGALLAVSLAAFAGPANAAEWCFEGLGNTGCPWKETFPNAQLKQLSCQNLWQVRNSIYDRHGYCFKTQDAIDVFDNSDCSVQNAASIQFNQHESTNISRIKKIEKNKGC
jgi:hypothetical protein